MMDINTIFVFVFDGLFIMVMLITQRGIWMAKQRLSWVWLVHVHNMEVIERTAAEDPFELKEVLPDLMRNYDAIESRDFRGAFWKMYRWKLDVLVVNQSRYERVMEYHRERRERLN